MTKRSTCSAGDTRRPSAANDVAQAAEAAGLEAGWWRRPIWAIGPIFDALRVRALLRARHGDPDHRTSLDRAQAIAESVGDLAFLAPVAAARAECAWLEGRQAEIGPVTESAFELALRRRAPSFAGELGLWQWRAGLLDEPPTDAGEPYAHQIAGDWARAANYWHENGCRYQARGRRTRDTSG